MANDDPSTSSSGDYQVLVLGPLTVAADGAVFDLGGPKQRLVLALLVARIGDVVSTDALIDGLWGEDPPPTARKAVQVHVSNLRRALGEGFPLRTAPGGYVLQHSNLDVDAAGFEAEFDTARAKLRTDPVGAERMLTAALDRWKGPGYSDLDHEPALEPEIARLSELRLRALEARVDAGLRVGRHADLVGELTILCAEHPYREKLTELLMLALYRSGRQAEALRAYERTRSVLVEELGVEPGPSLQDLHHQILEQSAELDLDEGSIADRFAFLATDIESSTALWEADPDAMQLAVARHDHILADAVTANAGTVFKGTGDGVYAVFAGAADALHAAVDAQLALFGELWTTDRPLRVRMGVDEGPASARGGDYFGPALNRVSRIMSSGHGGQVLCPADVAAQAPTATRDLGGADYKGVGRVDVAQLEIPGVPHDFPDLETDRAPKTLVREGFGRAIRGYELREQLGEGAHGVVYRAYQASIGREVAIKVIRPEHANQPEFVNRFEAEAQFVAQLEHPHIVSLYDYWRDPDGAYLVMQVLRGGSLASALERAPWRPPAAMKLLDQVGTALDYAHRQGVMHHDLKPANVLLDSEGNAYLSDFSIAARHIEAVGVPVGDTVTYLSPEELAGEAAGPAADMYGLALLTYEIFTGERPALGGQPSPLAELRPDLPPTLDEILARAADPDPSRRFDRVDDFLRALRRGFGTDVVTHERRVAPADIRNPYKGLRAFAETDADDFFGRDELVEELLDHVTSHRLTAVVGPSGSGKSSLVRAGLLPRIRRRAGVGPGTVLVTDMFPGSYPFEELEAALLRVGVAHQEGLLAELEADDRGLLRMSKQLLPDDDSELLLVIDQFEELFLLTHDDEARQRFLANLVTVAGDERSRVRLVITMRADHFDRPLIEPEFGALLRTAVVPVSMPTYDELTRAIAQPAEGAGLEFAAGLIPRIVGDVADEPGALPLLQYALTELAGAREGADLTMAGYELIGGVEGALTRRAEEIYDGLGEAARDATREVFLRLVAVDETGEDTRRRARRSELESLGLGDAALDATLDRFGSYRLLSFDRDPVTRGPTVEVAHEALIREWPRLAGWIDERREDLVLERRLEAASAEWDSSGQDSSFLFSGGKLDQYEEWASATDVRLTMLERDFLDDARRADDEDRGRRRRRRRGVMAALGLFAMLACAAALVALAQRNDANRSADDAEEARATADTAAAEAESARARAVEQAFESETGRLTATAASLADTDPRVAMLLTVAARQRDRSAATLGGLQQSMLGSGPVLQRLAWGRSYLDVEWGAGERVIGTRTDGLDLIDVETGAVLDSVPVVNAATATAITSFGRTAIDDSGSLVAVLEDVPDDQTDLRDFSSLSVYRVGEQFDLAFTVPLDAVGLSVDVSPSGDLIVVGGATATENVVQAWSPDGDTLWEPAVALARPSNVFLQAAPLLGGRLTDPQGWAAPVGNSVSITEDQVFVANGVLLHRFDRAAQPLGAPIVVTTEDGSKPGFVTHVVERGSAELVVDTTSGGATALVEPSEGWPETLTLAPLGPAFSLGGETALTAATLVGDELLATRAGGVLVSYDPLTAEETDRFELGDGRPTAVAPSPTGDRVAVAHASGVSIVAVGDGGSLAVAIPRKSAMNFLSVSDDGSSVLMSPSFDPAGSTVELWRLGPGGPTLDPADGALDSMRLGILTSNPDRITGSVGDSAFSRDSVSYALDTWEVVDEWTTYAGSSINLFPQETPLGILRAVAVTDPFRGIVVFRDGELDEPEWSLPMPGDPEATVRGLAFDPLRPRLLVANASGEAQLWDLVTRSSVLDEHLRGAEIASGAWNADGTLVATMAPDGTVSIRDGETLEEIRVIAGLGPVVGFAGLIFSPDDTMLLTTTGSAAQLWDVATGERIGLELPNVQGMTLIGNVDEEQIRFVTASDTHALVWNLAADTWADVACRAAGSNLDADEWAQWGPRDSERYAICPEYPLPD